MRIEDFIALDFNRPDLNDRDIGIRVLAGQGSNIDTTTASGKLVFALFAALTDDQRRLLFPRRQLEIPTKGIK